MAKKKAKELDLADVLAGELNKYSKDQNKKQRRQNIIYNANIHAYNS